jgi:hypothetical protein
VKLATRLNLRLEAAELDELERAYRAWLEAAPGRSARARASSFPVFIRQLLRGALDALAPELSEKSKG